MKVKVCNTKVKTIRKEDPLFTIKSGVIVYPRAGFEVDPRCPKEYRTIIHQCIDYGWIKPVAFVEEKELAWNLLKD